MRLNEAVNLVAVNLFTEASKPKSFSIWGAFALDER